MLLLIAFLDSPFHKGIGGVRPAAMERTLRIVDEALQAVGVRAELPCDAQRDVRLVTEVHKRDWVEVGATRPARLRGSRDGVEQLSGHALERRAGEDVGQA